MEYTPHSTEMKSLTAEEQLAQAEVAISEARAEYNEAILGIIVVDRSCEPTAKGDLDKTICSCQEKLAYARDARDRLLAEVFSFVQPDIPAISQ